MRKKGASRSACISFLITAPETGADSILVTHAFFGFVAAVVRPLVSFITAVITGIVCIGLIRDDSHDLKLGAPQHHAHGKDDCGHEHRNSEEGDCSSGHDHGVHRPLMTASEDCYVSPPQLKAMLFAWAGNFTERNVLRADGTEAPSLVKPALYSETIRGESSDPIAVDATGGTEADAPSLGKVIKHVFRYGFAEVADDILFALIVGVAIGGLLYMAIPDDLMSSEHARWLSYPVMVLVGIPHYICASASTPIAAALVAKGLSPGAALIFLMTGPSTNSGTIAIIVRQFGARFGFVYVAGVIAVTTVLGISIDTMVIAWGLTLPVNLSASDLPAAQFVEWTGAVVLIALIFWRLRARMLKGGHESSFPTSRPQSAA